MSASSFDDGAVARAARQLAAAAADHAPCAPVNGILEPFGIAGAYAAQQINNAARRAAGARVVGHKIGLTSSVVQRQLGVDQPDTGLLFDDMLVEDGSEVAPGRLIQPKVEAEIAFVLDKDLTGERFSVADLLSAIGYALPAIEIVDSRIAEWKISILDTVADNASSGLFVLGTTPRKIDDIDLRLCGMTMENRGEPVATGCGAACLGHPLHALAWLAKAAVANGQPLRAGDIILSGALGPMVPAISGEVYEARISGLGRVSAVFGAAVGS